jgi:hypothetical protein
MNHSPIEIGEAIATILESTDDKAVVLTDLRFSKTDQELPRLLKGQADIDEWRGWTIEYAGIAGQVNVSGGECLILVTHRFKVNYYHFYLNDYKDGMSTDISFITLYFAGSEALNEKLSLDLTDKITHKGLISAGDFVRGDIGGGSVSQVCHKAPNFFDVEVTSGS